MEKRLYRAPLEKPAPVNTGGGAVGLMGKSIIPRLENDAYHTIFVQADTSSFKRVVQMLTGCDETVAEQQQQQAGALSPPIEKGGPKKQAFKLHERRSSSFNDFNIRPLLPGVKNQNGFCGASVGAAEFSPRNPEVLSPSFLNFPSLALSPVTPLIADPFNRSPTPADQAALAEERAIAEKGFFLHLSPASTPRGTEPQLLPLFPETSH